jgi:16S rRNA (adenine1518-N6/adenine1519-N6)-dimethyltransferase
MGARHGQHFLRDDDRAQRIVGYADLAGSETVLEVGPGKGALTRHLAEAAGTLVAVERDESLAREVRAEFPSVEVLAGDVLELDLPAFDVTVANLPYQISSPWTFRLLETGFDRAVHMYQRAFAERLRADPGDDAWGRLSVAVQVQAEVEHLEIVPRGAFQPPPDVESALVRILPRDGWTVDVEGRARWEAVLQAGFAHRRKRLDNALASGARFFSVPRDEIKTLKGEIPHGADRAEALTPGELAEVERFLADRGVDAEGAHG